jgi:Holliday junction resolvasome RuvABC endonuclease subunit
MAGVILSINPGRVSGVALLTILRSPRLVAHRRVRVDDGTRLLPLLEEWRTYGAVEWCCIEDQYVAASVRSSIALAHTAGRWHQAATEYGVAHPVEYVTPARWQACLGLPARAPRAQRKRTSIAMVRSLHGVEVGHEVADAVMMGRWYAVCKLAERGESFNKEKK